MGLENAERRRFKRINAPVFARPCGNALVKDKRSVQDISAGGVCVYTDDTHRIGDHLELELYLPDGEPLTLDTEIVWVDPQPSGAAAKFEVGLRFVEISEGDAQRLQAVLKEV